MKVQDQRVLLNRARNPGSQGCSSKVADKACFQNKAQPSLHTQYAEARKSAGHLVKKSKMQRDQIPPDPQDQNSVVLNNMIETSF